MSVNLITQLMNEFRGGPLNRVATALGESTTKTQAALGGVLPALVGSLASKASTPEGANDLLHLIHEKHLDSGPFGDVSGAVSAPDGVAKLMNTGRPLLETVLGDRSNSVTEWVSSLAGINRTSSASILSLTLPVVLGSISKAVSAAGSGATSLMSLMSGQTFMQNAPAGLAGALGFDDGMHHASMVGAYNAPSRQEPPRHAPVVAAYEPPRRRSSPAWLWMVPVALLGILGYFLLSKKIEAPGEASLPTVPKVDIGKTVNTLGAFVERKLPNEVTLNFPLNGTESKLVEFIEDSTRQVDKDTWFSFDRLAFDTDSATLQPSSNEQLRNIAEILKAYPKVNIKIGGYTDNVGHDAHNLKLSQDRATNTMNEIANLGVDRSRLAAEGYGNNNPVGDNATEEGRQLNRRIDIRVTQK